MSKIYTSADQLIGHTPLLELTHIEAAEGLEAKLLAKLEYFNPAGSVKDRIAKAMLDDAEAAGKLICAVNPAREEAELPLKLEDGTRVLYVIGKAEVKGDELVLGAQSFAILG